MKLYFSPGYDEIVELLIDKNGKVAAVDEYGYNALHFASINGKSIATANLIEIIHCPPKILIWCWYFLGHVNIAKILLNHGAEIDAKTNKNQTALMLAVKNGHYDVVNELLRNEADINVSDESEKALLDLASQQSNWKPKQIDDAMIFYTILLILIRWRRHQQPFEQQREAP